MKDRIKHIMEQENLTPAKFADRLQISRAIISHILNGRNNPSLDVVTRILSEMNYINPEWLLSGNGTMYKEGTEIDAIPKEPDLFHQPEEKASPLPLADKKPQGAGVNTSDNHLQDPEIKSVTSINEPTKEISQIIVYFTDQTFKIFTP